MANTTELLAMVKQKAMLPDGQITLTDPEILRMATEELRNVIFPLVLSAQGGYYQRYKDYTLSAARVYRLPARSAGNAIVDVTVVSGDEEVSLNWYKTSELKKLEGFHIQGANIVLTTNTRSSGTLRIYFNAVPNKLILSAEACRIESISSLGNDWQLSWVNPPVVPAGLIQAGRYDVVSGEAPHDWLAFDFSSDTPDDPADTFINVPKSNFLLSTAEELSTENKSYLVRAGESPYPQCPVELHPVLADLTAIRCLESIGFHDDAKAIKAGAKDSLQAVLVLISPRVDSEERYVINRSLITGRDY